METLPDLLLQFGSIILSLGGWNMAAEGLVASIISSA